jgi:mRNA-degrading endonuclease toxin of MazEF toxin-antitoxin module
VRHRPVLIVSPTAFNALTKLPVVLPITNGGGFVRRIGFGVEISGIKTTGIVRCDRPRGLGISERGGSKVDTLPAEILEDVLAKAAVLFQ